MCNICCFSYMQNGMFSLSCAHQFCKNCMSDHLKTKIMDGQVLKINCMSFKCKVEFKSEDIKNFGSSEIYAKYLKFKENINVELDKNLKWCPRQNCLGYVRRQKSCCCCTSSIATCECG